MRYSPLGRRYTKIGRAARTLNAVQRRARDEIIRKIELGIYQNVDVSCPLCGASEGTVVSQTENYGLPYETAICAQCGFVYANRYLALDSLHNLYNDEYCALTRGYEEPGDDFFKLQYNKAALIARAIEEAGVWVEPGALVVEIGCSAGGILGYFRDQGFKVLGFDIGDAFLRYGREKHGLDLRQGSLPDAIRHIQDGQLKPTLVIYEQVLEHMPDPIAELRTLREAIPDDGYLFVGVPGLKNIERHYNADFFNSITSVISILPAWRVLRRALGSNLYMATKLSALFLNPSLYLHRLMTRHSRRHRRRGCPSCVLLKRNGAVDCLESWPSKDCDRCGGHWA